MEAIGDPNSTRVVGVMSESSDDHDTDRDYNPRISPVSSVVVVDSTKRLDHRGKEYHLRVINIPTEILTCLTITCV